MPWSRRQPVARFLNMRKRYGGSQAAEMAEVRAGGYGNSALAWSSEPGVLPGGGLGLMAPPASPAPHRALLFLSMAHMHCVFGVCLEFGFSLSIV